MLEDSGTSHLRAVHLNDFLQRVKTIWTRISVECYAIKTYAAVCVDVTLAPSPSLLWCRTTLVKGRWQLFEYNLFVYLLRFHLLGESRFFCSLTIGFPWGVGSGTGPCCSVLPWVSLSSSCPSPCILTVDASGRGKDRRPSAALT